MDFLNAIASGDLDYLRQALNYGLDVNMWTEPNESGERLLVRALHGGQFAAARLLLEHGADPNAWATPQGGTAFAQYIAYLSIGTCAGERGDHVAMVEALLSKYGADPNGKGDDWRVSSAAELLWQVRPAKLDLTLLRLRQLVGAPS